MVPNCSIFRCGSGKPELRVEGLDVAGDRRRAERVDDHDRPATAGDALVVQRVQVIRRPVLQRRVAADPEVGLAVRRGDRRRELRLDVDRAAQVGNRHRRVRPGVGREPACRCDRHACGLEGQQPGHDGDRDTEPRDTGDAGLRSRRPDAGHGTGAARESGRGHGHGAPTLCSQRLWARNGSGPATALARNGSCPQRLSARSGAGSLQRDEVGPRGHMIQSRPISGAL